MRRYMVCNYKLHMDPLIQNPTLKLVMKGSADS